MEKSKKNKLATDSFILTFVQCITLMTGIIQTMLLSRVLTKSEYGTYSQGLLIINFITPFLILGMGNTINFFYNQEKEKNVLKKYVNTIFGIVTIIGGFAGIIIIVLRDWICQYFNNQSLYPLLVYIAFRPVLRNLVTLYQPLFISNNMAKAIAIRNLLVGIGQVGIIAIVLVFSKNLTLIFGLLLVLDLLQVVIFEYVFKEKAFKVDYFSIEKEMLPEIFQYAMPLMFSSMVGTISVNMDKMLIGRMMSVEEFAIYSNMAKELPLSFIVTSLTTVVMPILIRLHSSGELEKVKRLWGLYLEIGYICTWTLTCGAILCAEELIIFLYSEQYVSGKNVFVIYLLVEIIRFTFFGMILTVYGQTKRILFCSVASLVTNFVLNYILFQCVGMIGPAIATLISVIVVNGLQLRYSFKLLNTSFREIIYARNIGFFLVKLLLIMLGVYMFKTNIVSALGNNFFELLITYGVFVILMFGFMYKRIKEIILALNSNY